MQLFNRRSIFLLLFFVSGGCGLIYGAIEINPENVRGYVGIGEAYRQSGNMPKAIEWYRRALRLDSDQPIAQQYVK